MVYATLREPSTSISTTFNLHHGSRNRCRGTPRERFQVRFTSEKYCGEDLRSFGGVLIGTRRRLIPSP
ncbi:hypothetical protein CROQUDRAFT_111687, partial [Cronartium quercuum f. sp. fusiforme G11]